MGEGLGVAIKLRKEGSVTVSKKTPFIGWPERVLNKRCKQFAWHEPNQNGKILSHLRQNGNVAVGGIGNLKPLIRLFGEI